MKQNNIKSLNQLTVPVDSKIAEIAAFVAFYRTSPSCVAFCAWYGLETWLD